MAEQNKEKKTDIKKSILRRVRALYILFFGLGLAIAGKILYIQYGPNGEEMRKRSVEISYERMTIEADRGDVLSRDGRILATSIPMYEIRMDFAAQGLVDSVFSKNVDSLAHCLANFFKNKSSAAYKSMLTSAWHNKKQNRYTLISPRRVDHMEIKEISKFPIFRLGQNRGGFIPLAVNKRELPHGSLASRTIGRVNEAGTKLGIEGAFDSILKGVDGNMLMQKISGSFKVPIKDELSVDPIDGIDVVTTIDVDIQDVAETALRKQLETGDADWGTAILMEVSTGEIRAIANLTRKSEGVFEEDYNYAIGMNLEPGSTFKLATLMTLLDDAGASLDEVFTTDGGKTMIGRAKVEDTHDYGTLTLRGVFEHSSNIGFAKAVNKYYGKSPEKFVDHLYKMGLNSPMNLQIRGEQQPLIRKPKDRWWDGTTLTFMSYGYALQLTPLKTLSFYNAVANNGKMVSPLLVKELRQYGQPLRIFTSDVIVDKIATDKTLDTVRKALQGVVDDGTAGVLRNPYYKVAAKTGTAQIAIGRSGYTDRFGGRSYLATLVGYFPADNPKYSCIVAMKTYNGPGRRSTYYGASLAGPVFRAIADRVHAQNTAWQTPVSKKNEKVDAAPTLKMGNTREIKKIASSFSIPYTEIKGSNWMGYNIEKNTDSTKATSVIVPLKQGSLPSVLGMGLKEALYLLESEGLVVTFSGVGGVVSQSIAPGTKAERGAVIKLTLSNKKEL